MLMQCYARLKIVEGIIQMPDNFLYVVHFTGDSDDTFEWYFVFPTKKQAMKQAEETARDSGKEVRYLSYHDPRSVLDMDPTAFIVVEQTEYLYHGA